jgi:protein-disulfide isomerase
MECAAEQNGGSEAYYAMKAALFALWSNPTLDNIRSAATNAGFDADAIMDCVDADTYAQKVRDQMTFGRQLGVTWTPWNIVMNNETGDFVKVSWAVPATAFDAAISQFLN